MEDIELRRELERFRDSRVFRFIQNAVQEQVDGLQKQVILRPLASADEVFAQEYRKGQIEGRLALNSVVEGMIASLLYDEIKETKDE